LFSDSDNTLSDTTKGKKGKRRNVAFRRQAKAEWQGMLLVTYGSLLLIPQVIPAVDPAVIQADELFGWFRDQKEKGTLHKSIAWPNNTAVAKGMVAFKKRGETQVRLPCPAPLFTV